jgi:hypothetical protein
MAGGSGTSKPSHFANSIPKRLAEQRVVTSSSVKELPSKSLLPVLQQPSERHADYR